MAASAGGDGRERKPLVSIVIVAGSGDRLPRAIESACRQSWDPTETVVVHDGTSAAIAAAIERYPGVRSVVHRDCGGRGAARNAGLGAIGGDYVAFIGGDDLLFPGAVAAGVAQLEADRAAALAVGAIQDADAPGNPLGEPILPDRPDEPYIALLHRDYIGDCAAVLFRRAALEQVGGFAAERSLGADWDLYLRLAYRFPLTHHPTAVSARRCRKRRARQSLR
jgi:glycosyltransferase involved in cell wall biosynthesis